MVCVISPSCSEADEPAAAADDPAATKQARLEAWKKMSDTDYCY